MLTPADVYAARAHLLAERLDWLERAITPPGAAPGWAEREFAREIGKVRVASPVTDADDRPRWGDLADRERRCERLFREGFTFLQYRGVPALDPAARSLAEALVAGFGEACGLREAPLIVSDLDDSYSDFVPMIRVRFPCAVPWDVAVLAHEYGHYAAYRLTAPSETGVGRSQALAELIRSNTAGRAAEEAKRRTHLINEHFADMLATYILGPAFAASLLLLRLDLAAPHRPGGLTHPSSAARGAIVLFTLQRMAMTLGNAGEQQGALASLRTWLRNLWQVLVGPAGDEDAADMFKVDAGELYGAMTSMVDGAIYRGWAGVHGTIQYQFDGVGGRPAGGAAPAISAPDLLNAAWMRGAGRNGMVESARRARRLWTEQRFGPCRTT